MINKKEELRKLYEEMKNCHKCEISSLPENQDRPEGGENPDAEIMIVGIALSKSKKKRIRKGRFCTNSRMDELICKALNEIGLSEEEDVFGTDAVKCFLPKNRKAKIKEMKEIIKNCRPFLEKEIKIINPKVIILMGREPCNLFNINFEDIRYSTDGKIITGIHHPAYCTRFGLKKGLPEKFLEHFRKVKIIMERV